MKIRCKKILATTTKEDLGKSSPWITIGKEYVVLAIAITPKEGIHIFIQSDHYHEPIFKSLDGFEVIDQKIPSNWITSTENSNYYMMPKSWLYNEFFEELENEESRAVALFNVEAEIIHRELG